MKAARIKIIPEESASQDTVEMREILYDRIKRLLQDIRVYFLSQLTGDAENARITASCCRRDYLCDIIKLIPLVITCHSYTHFRADALYCMYFNMKAYTVQSAADAAKAINIQPDPSGRDHGRTLDPDRNGRNGQAAMAFISGGQTAYDEAVYVEVNINITVM